MNRRNFIAKLAVGLSGLSLAPYIGVVGPIPASSNPLYRPEAWRRVILALYPDGPIPLGGLLEMIESSSEDSIIHLWNE